MSIRALQYKGKESSVTVLVEIKGGKKEYQCETCSECYRQMGEQGTYVSETAKRMIEHLLEHHANEMVPQQLIEKLKNEQ